MDIVFCKFAENLIISNMFFLFFFSNILYLCDVCNILYLRYTCFNFRLAARNFNLAIFCINSAFELINVTQNVVEYED